MKARTLITAGPPTSNGDLHLGHLSGPYTAGDILCRFRRMRGEDVTFVSAADDHQSYVALKARQSGCSPQDIVDESTDLITSSLERACVSMDYFGRPSRSARYSEFLSEFFLALHRKGSFFAKETVMPYCDHCETLLFEAHVRGTCQHCGAGADGGICEACGRPNLETELIEPLCAICSAPPSAGRPVTRLFFDLNPYREFLSRFVADMTMSAHAAALCRQMLAEELPIVAVTQPSSWGVEVPLAGYASQRLSAWFELGPHYLAVLHSFRGAGQSEDWRDVWSCDTEIVQCFGFDSTYFHAILFPAIFRAYDPEIALPGGFIINEFYRLDGRKFSTSRKHAIWASEFLQDESADALRYHLALTRAEREQTNFTLLEFRQSVGDELAGRWDEWLVGLARRATGRPAPPVRIDTEAQRRFLDRLAAIATEVEQVYDVPGFSPHRAARLLAELVREARSFRDVESVTGGDDQATLALELSAARCLALLAAPLMPEFAARLWRDLGERDAVRWESAPRTLPCGVEVALSPAGYFSDAKREEPVAAPYCSQPPLTIADDARR